MSVRYGSLPPTSEVLDAIEPLRERYGFELREYSDEKTGEVTHYVLEDLQVAGHNARIEEAKGKVVEVAFRFRKEGMWKGAPAALMEALAELEDLKKEGS